MMDLFIHTDTLPRILYLLSLSLFLFQERVYGFYPFTITDHASVEGVFLRLSKQDWLSCVIACASIHRCVSCNYELRTTGRLGHCELSELGFPDNTKQGHVLSRAEGWVFHQARPCKVILKLAVLINVENK